jgi:hypothetical protein
MGIYRKQHVVPHLEGLESYYRKLRSALEGTAPNPNNAEQYHSSPDRFEREYIEIDFDLLVRMAKHFRVEAEGFGALKKKAAKPIHR